MSSRLDVAAVVSEMNEYLVSNDFKRTTPDGPDFQYGSNRTLRFSTGTVYGEVTIYAHQIDEPTKKFRIFGAQQVPEAKHWVDRIIAKWRTP